jgi:hypothetical protein
MHRIALAALTLVAFTACTETRSPSAYADLLPDQRILVSMPDELAGARGGRAEFYGWTAEVTRGINDLIGTVVLTLDLVTDLPPTWSDTEADTAAWGPFGNGLDPAETILWVTREDAVYSWVIGVRPRNSQDDWTPIVAGQVSDDGTPEDNDGWFVFDFDAAHELDPSIGLTGTFTSEYDISPDGVVASAFLDDFSDQGSTPVDAAYHYTQDLIGAGQMDLAIHTDLNPESGTALEEVLRMRSRWTPAGTGRADALITEGDLEALVGTASECWDEHFQQVYYVDSESWATPIGHASACVFDTESFHQSDAT